MSYQCLFRGYKKVFLNGYFKESTRKTEIQYTHIHNNIMLNATVIVFIVIFSFEAFLIIIGNAFTIFVFWTQRLHQKRTFFLLINLAVADLLVGIIQVVVLTVTDKISDAGKEAINSPFVALQAFGLTTTVFSLALISLERVYSVLWPLRHRATNTRVYICSIVIVWVAGLCLAGLWLLPIYHTNVESMYATVTINSFLFISLLVICASYLTIRSRLHRSTPELQVHHQTSTERNLRISKTFFLVVAVSLLFYLPAFVVYTIIDYCWECFSPTVLMLVNILHLANSMVNPFVYSFRMPIFKDALRKCWRKRRQNFELRVVPFTVHNENPKTEFITQS